MKLIAINYNLKSHVIHVSGTRMQAQGSDGLLQVNIFCGAMIQESMLSFSPLYLSAIDDY